MWIVTAVKKGNDDYADANVSKKFGDVQTNDMFDHLTELFGNLDDYEAIHVRYIDKFVPNFVLGGDASA